MSNRSTTISPAMTPRRRRGRDSYENHILLDLVHVLEYLWRAGWCFHTPGDPAVEDWVATQALQVLSG
ncbi:hypothetical protein GFY24_40295, partial [Nocardia sp. SYP-A9097]|uniref:hypothetical protein n=1 Tax=Nocardia sp. SYP-A9097 TaxID=2663237 RepID=UPI00129AF46E